MAFSENFYGDIYLKTHLPLFSEDSNEKEAAFYAEILDLPIGSSILELPCGFGRHAIPLARFGYQVTALDNSEKFIELAKENSKGLENVKFMLEDMRNISFNSEFDAVVNAATGFGYFSDQENFDLLKKISQSLKKGGKLMMEAINREPTVTKMSQNGLTWILYPNHSVFLAMNKYDIFTGRWNSEQMFVENGELTSQQLEIRLYTLPEMKFLMEQVGLEIYDCYGDKNKNDYSEKSESMIILAKKV